MDYRNTYHQDPRALAVMLAIAHHEEAYGCAPDALSYYTACFEECAYSEDMPFDYAAGIALALESAIAKKMPAPVITHLKKTLAKLQ